MSPWYRRAMERLGGVLFLCIPFLCMVFLVPACRGGTEGPDSEGRVHCRFAVEGTAMDVVVDRRGRVVSRRLTFGDESPSIFRYAYDVEGRVTQIHEQQGDQTRTFRMRYDDGEGRAVADGVTRTLTFDSASRTVIHRVESEGLSPSWEECTFDEGGRLVRHRAPGARTIRFVDGAMLEEVGPDQTTTVNRDAAGHVVGEVGGMRVQWNSPERLVLTHGGQRQELPAVCEAALLPPCAWLWRP